MKGTTRNSKKGMTRRTFVKSAAGVSAATVAFGVPALLKGADDTIKIGMPSIFTGRVAILGISGRAGAMSEINRINNAGGINGRKLELITRDSKGKPDEAAKATRELVNSAGCQIILHAETSGSAFAIQEVIRDLGVLGIHGSPETTSLTADPKIRSRTAFRSARVGIHDAVGSGAYAAQVAKEKDLTKWMSCSPDYAYGRTNTEEFLLYAKKFNPKIEMVDAAWPKIFQPDYTEVVTKILQVKPQALYSALWGGDLTAFIDQGNLYGMFEGLQTFSINLGDYPVLNSVKNLPAGMHCGSRYNKTVPPTKANLDWYNAYVKENTDHQPTNWSWELAAGAAFIIAGLKRTNGNTDGNKLADAIAGLTIDSPFGVDGTLTMRAVDHQVTGYAVGFGIAIQEEPKVKDFKAADWNLIFEMEKEYWKSQGWA